MHLSYGAPTENRPWQRPSLLSLLLILLLLLLLLLLFISHTTCCIGGHVSLGHQAISYSLECLGSFLRSLLFPTSRLSGVSVPIVVTHIIKFLVPAPSTPNTTGPTDTLFQFHIFCISTFKVARLDFFRAIPTKFEP